MLRDVHFINRQESLDAVELRVLMERLNACQWVRVRQGEVDTRPVLQLWGIDGDYFQPAPLCRAFDIVPFQIRAAVVRVERVGGILPLGRDGRPSSSA